MARYSVWAMLRVIFNVWQWHPPLMTDASKRRPKSAPRAITCHKSASDTSAWLRKFLPTGNHELGDVGQYCCGVWQVQGIAKSASIDNIKWMRAHRLAAHQVTTANQNMIGTSVHKVAHQFSADSGTSEHTGGTSVHTAEQNISQSTQAAHQYTRRNISAQSGTWLNWLTDRQCISALDTTELSIHWLTETEWTKDLNFKCSDMTHKWNHDSCTYN